jgi:ketosteroid isomerase-like protein
MSESISQIIRNNYDAFGKGNIDPLMSSLADGVKWHVSGGSPLAGEYVGKAEVLNFFRKMMQLYGGTLRIQVVDILAGEKHSAVLTREESQYNGEILTFRSVHLREVRGGKKEPITAMRLVMEVFS